MREQPDILEDVTDPPPQPVRLDRVHGRPVDQHATRARLDESVDRLEQGRLARSRRADQRHEAARCDVDRHALDRDRTARIALDDRVERDRRTEGGSWSGHSERLWRSEEHTSELQSLMRISYAVFCLKKKILIVIQNSYM